MPEIFPITTTITLGRIFNGVEASPTDDWFITLSGYTELVDTGVTYRISLKDKQGKLSQLNLDPSLQDAPAKVYIIAEKILKGELQFEEPQQQVQDEASPSDPEPGV